MLERILNWSLAHRWAVLLLALALMGTGVHALLRLPLDAFPDTTPVQVQVNTVAPALGPLEIEQQITVSVEQALAGLPGLAELRSISKFGLSQVTAVFEDGTDIYFARQVVMEGLQALDLPEGIDRPEMGPVATGLGEVYHYLVTGRGHSLEALTTLHDWVIKPRLRSVKGVAEVNTWGGERRQYQVLVDLGRLAKHDLTLADVSEALRAGNTAVGGGAVVQAGELHAVRGLSLTSDTETIGNTLITTHAGVPIRVRDVADVEQGHEWRRGAVTAGGQGEVVLGLAFMRIGENSREVTRRLTDRMAEVSRSLPPGVVVTPVYNRTTLVSQVLRTVRTNLLEGAVLVVAVLFVFLGSVRAGLIVAAAIPLSMLFALSGMLRLGIVGTLMSLGAIDFGFIVDSTLVMMENNARGMAEAGRGAAVLDVVRRASLQVLRPTVFAQSINMIVYLPVLALAGIEGKLFRPMAWTMLLALFASVVFICTLLPVLTTYLFRRGRRPWRDRITPVLAAVYRPVLRAVLRRPAVVAVLPAVAAGAVVYLTSRSGSEFVPRLSEMGIVINTVRLAGVSLEESVRYGERLEALLAREFPREIQAVWTRTGTAEVATDPMGLEVSDIFITLTPRRQWTRARTQDDLVAAMRAVVGALPGMRAVFTQPIEMRVNEMTAAIRSDLGIKIFGDDLEVLKAKAAEVEAIVRAVPGAADVYAEQVTGQPVLEVHVDPAAAARHGLSTRAVLDLVEAVGEKRAGLVRDGQRRFDVVVRLAEAHRRDPAAVAAILVPTADGRRIPLGRLAHVRHVEGPSTITREWQKRRIVVQANVQGRDLGNFVAEVRRRIAASLDLPPGYHVTYGGQFEHLARARQRLAWVIPLALGLIFLLLYLSTRSVRDSLVVFTGPIFAAFGGLAAMAIRGMPFTVTAGVGLVVASGVSVLNGLVLISAFRERERAGLAPREAIEGGALRRLRPVCMAGLVAILGFLPMALSTGVGAEVQRPLATVVIGGALADNLLTLVVVPALCALSRRRRDVGAAPPVAPSR